MNTIGFYIYLKMSMKNKTKLVDELLMKAAFLKVQLDELEVSLKKHGRHSNFK